MGSFNKEALKFLNENSIFIAPDIPEKKAMGAINAYAIDTKYDNIIILIDDTAFGSGKCGIVVTDYFLYAKEDFESALKIDIRDIEHFSVKSGILSSELLVDGQKIISLTQPSRKALECIAEILNEHLHGVGTNTKFGQVRSNLSNADMAVYYYEGEKEGVILANQPLKIIEYFGGQIGVDELRDSYYRVSFSGYEIRESQQIGVLKLHRVNETISILNQLCDEITHRHTGEYFGTIPFLRDDYSLEQTGREIEEILIFINQKLPHLLENGKDDINFTEMGAGFGSGLMGMFVGGALGAIADGVASGFKKNAIQKDMLKIRECISYAYFGVNVLNRILLNRRYMFVVYDIELKG